ncbi:MAG: M14 family zinc carboxypeptidase, partial [Bacteroidota bacterium]
MRLTLLVTILLLGIGCYGQINNPQTNKMTEKFFPEIELDINTPAFQKDKGFTKYDEMMSYLDGLVKDHSDLISYSFIGTSQKGKEIPFVKINKGSSEGKIRFWIQGGLHGNEPGSTEGVLYLISEILKNPELTSLLDDIELGIIPMANIDGYEKQDRYAANGLDLNRDQTKLDIHESVFLKKAFSEFNADVAMDIHEYRPFRRDYARMGEWGLTSPYEVMFLYSSNLNVPEELRNYTIEKFVEPTKSVLTEQNLKTCDYFSSTKHFGEIQLNRGSVNSRSSATSYALSNAISTLVEVRGVGLGRTSFKRRVNSVFLTITNYLKIAADQKTEIKALLKRTGAAQNKVVVASEKGVSGEFVEMIDVGSNEMISVDVPVRKAVESKELLTRTLPEAYVILPGNSEVIDKLTLLGVA